MKILGEVQADTNRIVVFWPVHLETFGVEVGACHLANQQVA